MVQPPGKRRSAPTLEAFTAWKVPAGLIDDIDEPEGASVRLRIAQRDVAKRDPPNAVEPNAGAEE
jgi:hypothetical protein